MNRVLWMQQWMLGRRAKHTKLDAVHPAHNRRNSSGDVQIYFSLPKRQKRPVRPTKAIAPSVYVHLPYSKVRHRSKNQGKPAYVSPALISLFSLIATIFAAIGLLNIMINTLHLSAYGGGQWRAETAVHKPGSGPAPQDAVANEYQHALTREMVPLGDTSIVTTVNAGTPLRKGLLDDVQVSMEKKSTQPKDGASGRQIRIFNGTGSVVEKVIVQVDILSKSGRLLRTESLTADTLQSMGVRIIDLSNVLPDATVHCFIQEIRSRSLRTSLRSL